MTCTHYNGSHNEQCYVGIPYNDVRSPDKTVHGLERYPCTNHAMECPKRQYAKEVVGELVSICRGFDPANDYDDDEHDYLVIRVANGCELRRGEVTVVSKE